MSAAPSAEKGSESKDPPVFSAIAFHPRRPYDDDDDVTSMITQPLLTDYQDDDDYSSEGYSEDGSEKAIVVVVKDPKPSASTQRTGTMEKKSPRRMRRSTLTVAVGGNNDHQQQQHYDNSSSCYGKFIALGALTGFLIQVVSLGAYALMLVHYSNDDDIAQSSLSTSTTTSSSLTMAFIPSSLSSSKDDVSAPSSSSMMFSIDWFVVGLLSVLTQIDLIIYVLIWIAFTCTMTRGGMEFLRFQFASNDTSSSNNNNNKSTGVTGSTLKRRFVFVLGVYFLVGIVLGAFGAWTVIDVYLGFPIPFLPIAATVGVDLVLCYLMVCCYDLGKKNHGFVDDNDDDEEDDDDECVCC